MSTSRVDLGSLLTACPLFHAPLALGDALLVHSIVAHRVKRPCRIQGCKLGIPTPPQTAFLDSGRTAETPEHVLTSTSDLDTESPRDRSMSRAPRQSFKRWRFGGETDEAVARYEKLQYDLWYAQVMRLPEATPSLVRSEAPAYHPCPAGHPCPVTHVQAPLRPRQPQPMGSFASGSIFRATSDSRRRGRTSPPHPGRTLGRFATPCPAHGSHGTLLCPVTIGLDTGLPSRRRCPRSSPWGSVSASSLQPSPSSPSLPGHEPRSPHRKSRAGWAWWRKRRAIRR